MKHSLLKLAEKLDTAAKDCVPLEQLSKTSNFTLDEAYEIQRMSINRRFDRGEILTGYKLGFTSRAKMEQMNVYDIIWGRLTNEMEIKNGGILHLSNFIHPRIEPEIAFRIKEKIDHEIKLEDAVNYIDGIASALEIIDSRYENFKFSLEDVVADNSSSSAYVIGNWFPPDMKIEDICIKLILNNSVKQRGTSAAILGNPFESLVEISKMAVKYDLDISPGMVILAGAATQATYIFKNDEIEGLFERLDMVNLNVVS